MKITEKLMNVQRELKAPKGQTNDFGKYKYRNCEDILEAVKPLLTKERLALILNDNLILIGDRYYVQAIATLYDVDSDDILTASANAREPQEKKGMDVSQITGMSSSYARKYALNGLFDIDDTKDADTMDNSKAPNKIICEQCNKEILDTIRKDGFAMSAQSVANYSKSKFKKTLCVECQRKSAEK